MNKKYWIFFLLAGFINNPLWAGSMGVVESGWNYFGTVTIGPVWGTGGDTQSIYLTPEILATYDAENETSTISYNEVFAGIQRNFSHIIQAQLGLAVAATSNASLAGHIWDDGDPQFNNFIYYYKVQHTHVAVKGRLLADVGSVVVPWISGSVGVGINRASSFKNIPIIFEALPKPPFAGNTEASFAYNLGAGIQKSLSEHFQAGVGYEFADWGRSSLSRASGQTLNSGISINHYYTNGLLFYLTYSA